MANQDHIANLKQGMREWAWWRLEHGDTKPDLSYADLSGTILSGTNLSGADLSYANLSGADLSGTNLSYADLSGTDFSGANLKGTNLSGTDLKDTNLSGANLSGNDLSDTDLSGADFTEANLCGIGLMGTHLNNANLSGADLTIAYLMGAHLTGANLMGAKLNNANLMGAYLMGAHLNNANLSHSNLTLANLSGADLSGADLTAAVLVGTNLTGATLTKCSIYGISVWNVQLDGTKQDSLVITREGEPTITVDNLEVAQFIYLLLNYKKLRDILNAVTERGVLLLGRFGGGGHDVLQAIAARLRGESYLPIIFDFERPKDRDYTETVKVLAGLARFVIMDLSGPSVPQELSHTVPFFDIPFVPIIEKGRRSYSMFADLFKYPWVLKPLIEFATVEELLERMPAEVIAPAEEKHQARQKLLDELFKKA